MFGDRVWWHTCNPYIYEAEAGRVVKAILCYIEMVSSARAVLKTLSKQTNKQTENEG